MGGRSGAADIGDPTRLTAVERATAVAARGDTGVRRLISLAVRLLDVDFGFLSLVHADREVLTAVARPDVGGLPPELPLEQSVCQHLITSGSPLLVADLSEHPLLRDLAEVRELGLHSYAGTPVTSPDGHVLGGLCVGHRSPREWTPGDAALLADLAAAVSTELALRVTVDELNRVERIERTRAQEQAALHRVATAVAKGEAPEDVLQLVAEELAGLLDVSAALVLRFLPDGRADLLAGAGPRQPALDALTGCANALARVRATREPALGCNGDRPCAAVPVLLQGRCWGALVAITPQESEAALSQLEQLADFVRLVIVNTEAQRRLVELARTDPVTGVANRRAFDERLREELERARRHGEPLALALLDVDRFKATNDEHGHDVGDRVLRELSGRLAHELRGGDLLARVGGDEYALLLPETGPGPAAVAVGRISDAVAGLPLAGLPVTVTIGAAVVLDGHTTPDALYREADQALYRAKQAGRGTVQVTTLG